jgi:hypothetical protein
MFSKNKRLSVSAVDASLGCLLPMIVGIYR